MSFLYFISALLVTALSVVGFTSDVFASTSPNVNLQLFGFLLFCSPKPRERTENEKYYRDAKSKEKHLLPSIFDEASIKLSVVVPAFDESKRLPTMLKETVDYLEAQKKLHETNTYEIILVDDGSRDNTIDVAIDYAKTVPHVDLRVLALDRNRGKGGAVTQVIYAVVFVFELGY